MLLLGGGGEDAEVADGLRDIVGHDARRVGARDLCLRGDACGMNAISVQRSGAKENTNR